MATTPSLIANLERYETPPLPLLRLAVLGTLTDERRMFAEGADNFARIGAEWLDRRVTN